MTEKSPIEKAIASLVMSGPHLSRAQKPRKASSKHSHLQLFIAAVEKRLAQEKTAIKSANRAQDFGPLLQARLRANDAVGLGLLALQMWNTDPRKD